MARNSQRRRGREAKDESSPFYTPRRFHGAGGRGDAPRAAVIYTRHCPECGTPNGMRARDSGGVARCIVCGFRDDPEVSDAT